MPSVSRIPTVETPVHGQERAAHELFFLPKARDAKARVPFPASPRSLKSSAQASAEAVTASRLPRRNPVVRADPCESTWRHQSIPRPPAGIRAFSTEATSWGGQRRLVGASLPRLCFLPAERSPGHPRYWLIQDMADAQARFIGHKCVERRNDTADVFREQIDTAKAPRFATRLAPKQPHALDSGVSRQQSSDHCFARLVWEIGDATTYPHSIWPRRQPLTPSKNTKHENLFDSEVPRQRTGGAGATSLAD